MDAQQGQPAEARSCPKCGATIRAGRLLGMLYFQADDADPDPTLWEMIRIWWRGGRRLFSPTYLLEVRACTCASCDFAEMDAQTLQQIEPRRMGGSRLT